MLAKIVTGVDCSVLFFRLSFFSSVIIMVIIWFRFFDLRIEMKWKVVLHDCICYYSKAIITCIQKLEIKKDHSTTKNILIICRKKEKNSKNRFWKIEIENDNFIPFFIWIHKCDIGKPKITSNKSNWQKEKRRNKKANPVHRDRPIWMKWKKCSINRNRTW